MHDVPLPIGRSNLLLRARLDWAEIAETRVCVSFFFFFFTCFRPFFYYSFTVAATVHE